MSEACIRRKHGLIHPHDARLAVGDLPAPRHDDEAPREAKDRLHVVVDDDEGPPPLVEFADRRDDLLAQSRMHAREWLVEEQYRGFQHQTTPKLEQLLLSAGEVLGLELLDRRQIQELEIAARPPGHLGPGGVWARQTRHEHVLEDGHAAPQLGELKCARDAHAGVDVRRTAAHLLAAHQHAAGVRVEVAGQHVDQRGLAGAIWADEPDEVALGDREVHGVVRDDAPEPLDEAHAAHELDPLAHAAESFCGTSRTAERRPVRGSPSRTNPSHTGVRRPLRAKRMVSSRTTPKMGSRHWPYSLSSSSRTSTTNAPPTAVGSRSMPPITVMTTSLAISSRSPTPGVMIPM